MYDLEPHFAWINLYSAAQDPRSPFFEREYNEFYFDKAVYNYYIHPQWDQFGSNTLYIKILFADYQEGFAIIEMIGEWNDALYNDVMSLKREVLEILMQDGIQKFVMIGENVMNFHASDDAYYDIGFANGNQIFFRRDHALVSIHLLAFHENHGVFIADCAL